MSLRIHARPKPLPRRLALVLQLLVLVGFLVAWENVPKIQGLSKISPIFDTFFISSPTRVYTTVVALANGSSLSGSVWPFIRETLQSSLIGTAIGLVTGTLLGLLLSNDERLNQILRPFILGFNSVPRIAMIPIFVVLLGASSSTAIASASITCFFTVFFNAYAGGRTIPAQMIENAVVMGASQTELMRRVRLPFVLAWSFASLPNALSYGLLSVVTAELLTGYAGMGRLLIFAVGSASASLTVAVIVYLSTLGLVLVIVSDVLKRRWLHWWSDGRASA